MTYNPARYETISKKSARLVSAALLAAAIAVPVSASAATAKTISASAHGERISVKVPMKLLETEEGTARLYAALENKAEKSCKRTIPMKIGQTISTKRCTAKLMKGFVEALDDEGMTRLYESDA